MSAKNFTGIVDNSDDKVLFHNEDFNVTIFQNKVYSSNTFFDIPSDNGFLSALTHSKKRIAINIGEKTLSAPSSFVLLTDLIIASSRNATLHDLLYFSRIRFIGGMLNQLLPYSDVPVEIKNNKNPIPKPRATYSFDFSTNDMSCRFSVGYIIQTEYSTYEYSVNDKVYCEISFDKEQHISTIYKHYRCFNDLVAIMTNRKRNAFDEIHLFPSLDNSCDAFKFSHVYLKENEEAVVDKKPSVSFNDIENGVPILLELIYNSKKDIPSYSIGFIPESSKDFWNVTDDRVRSVFAALECEISINRAVKEHVEDVGLDDLCETVKTCVKAYREEHKGTSSISERTYNLVFNSIKHWSLTAFERIALLFQNYREELAEYHTKWYYDINEEDIQAFVKYRNNITHGKYQNLTQQITDCTKSMQVLVLCSLLDRASVSRDTIKKLCAYGLSD